MQSAHSLPLMYMCGLTPKKEVNEYVSCFHPLLAVPRGYTESGKPRYIPVKADQYTVDQNHNITWLKEFAGSDVARPIWIPCGRCIGCRLDKSREWALRCMLELKANKGIASFVTLTYNESSVPISYFPDLETGEALPVYSLSLDDLQRFWKRLRKALPNKIRYFACGEYGEHSFRPHYHAIIFGWRPSDLEVYQVNDSSTYYTSALLSGAWSCGNALVADVNFNTCAYVARYTAKKAGTVGDEFYKAHNIESPFLVMSRRPGIGWTYFEENPQFWPFDKIYVSGSDPADGRIPRSFLQKLEQVDPEIYQHLKETRENKGSVYERAVVQSAKVPYSKLLSDSEAVLLQKSRSLARKKL